MTRWRRRLAMVVSVLVLLGFTASLFVIFKRSLDQAELVARSVRSHGWSVGQAGIEYRRLQRELDRYRLHDLEVGADDVRLRFDILYSRIPLLTREVSPLLPLQREQLWQPVETILATLDDVDARFARLEELGLGI